MLYSFSSNSLDGPQHFGILYFRFHLVMGYLNNYLKYVYVHGHEYGCLWGPEQSIRSLGDGVTYLL